MYRIGSAILLPICLDVSANRVVSGDGRQNLIRDSGEYSRLNVHCRQIAPGQQFSHPHGQSRNHARSVSVACLEEYLSACKALLCEHCLSSRK